VTIPIPPYDLAAHRRRIPLLRTTIPLNNCSQAPQSDDTRRAALAYLDSWNTVGMDWDAWMAEVERARAAFASLIGAAPVDVALSSSVSEATSSLASALAPDGRRHRIVATHAEFPTVGHVWLAQERRGLGVDWVPVTDGTVRLEDYDPLLDDRTLLVSATHGYYQTGALQDLAAIAARAHDVGALVYVDAYQTLGTRPLDVRALDLDFLASGTLKFLMGMPGIAFLYVKPEVAERLHPTVTGWFGRRDPFAFETTRLDWASGARRFDTGTPPIVNAAVARAGIEMVASVGLEPIRAWTEVLSRRLVDGGRERGFQVLGTTDSGRKAPTTALAVRDADAAEAAMRVRGILTSARGPAIRLAPHFYNTIDEIDRALDALADVVPPEARA
jgi:selenocysteine lyase/cysteine desulfurase